MEPGLVKEVWVPRPPEEKPLHSISPDVSIHHQRCVSPAFRLCPYAHSKASPRVLSDVFLEDLELTQYCDTFSNIPETTLPKLCIRHLPQLGITQFDHQKKIMNAIRSISREYAHDYSDVVKPLEAEKPKVKFQRREVEDRTKAKVAKEKVPDYTYNGPSTATEDLLGFEECFSGLGEKTAEGKQERRTEWKVLDANANGYCSLNEVDKWVLSRLTEAKLATMTSGHQSKQKKRQKKDAAEIQQAKDLAVEAERLWRTFRLCYIRAFRDAANIMEDAKLEGFRNATADDYVQKREFRALCAYLPIYARMLDAFAMIDGGSAGVTVEDDRRISEAEFLSGYEKIRGHGFSGFRWKNGRQDKMCRFVWYCVATAVICVLCLLSPALSQLGKKTARQVFVDMDSVARAPKYTSLKTLDLTHKFNGMGMVLLDEWCGYLKRKEMEAGTAWGDLMSYFAD